MKLHLDKHKFVFSALQLTDDMAFANLNDLHDVAISTNKMNNNSTKRLSISVKFIPYISRAWREKVKIIDLNLRSQSVVLNPYQI